MCVTWCVCVRACIGPPSSAERYSLYVFTFVGVAYCFSENVLMMSMNVSCNWRLFVWDMMGVRGVYIVRVKQGNNSS